MTEPAYTIDSIIRFSVATTGKGDPRLRLVQEITIELDSKTRGTQRLVLSGPSRPYDKAGDKQDALAALRAEEIEMITVFDHRNESYRRIEIQLKGSGGGIVSVHCQTIARGSQA